MLPCAKRIKFSKTGKMQFISHLDLNRVMKTAMIRAGIPIYYSEGFNPHPKMVFALTLSIGAESVCELLDIKIVKEMSNDEIRERLDRALPDEIKILEVYDPEEKFTGVGWAEYKIGFESELDYSKLDSPEIVITKRTKSGEKDTDIKPQIRSWHADGKELTVVVCADNENYLNPDYIARFLGVPEYSYTIMRLRLFKKDGVNEFR